MNKENPKISVVMSVYNASAYLRESIESILNQTYTDFEFIIINDCSTDNSWEIINEYAKKDSRIVLINNPENIGLTKSLNKGLKIAKGEYIARQDADDVSLPQRFGKQVLVLDENPEVILVSCDLEVIDSEGNPYSKYQRSCKPEFVAWYLLFYNYLAGHSQVIFRREPVSKLGGYCETYLYAQDYQLWSRLVKIGQIYILPEILLQYRVHTHSISSDKKIVQDNFLFTQIQNNINYLIHKEITLEEAKYLMKFWSGYWNSDFFPSYEEAEKIHLIIRDIYQGFINQSKYDNLSDYNYIAYHLRIIIGKQFLLWVRSLKIKDSLLAKIKVSLCAFRWYPFGVFYRWFVDIVKSFLILFRPVSYRLSNIISLKLISDENIN